MKDILVTLALDAAHRQKLEAAAPGCRFTYAPDKELRPELVQAAQIIIGNPPPPASPPAAAWMWKKSTRLPTT